DCDYYVYFMTGTDLVMKQLGRLAPHIKRCVGGGNAPDLVVERAIEMGCEMVQFFKSHFSKEKIDLAHAHGIKCNYFFTDNPQRASELLDMGIDTILTNDYQRVANALGDRVKTFPAIPCNGRKEV
ncbi:MAG: hypothetical protein IJY04_00395, partial [Clostridia bacterium]|nr:hypothetical protein [Clostridia bacterium]